MRSLYLLWLPSSSPIQDASLTSSTSTSPISSWLRKFARAVATVQQRTCCSACCYSSVHTTTQPYDDGCFRRHQAIAHKFSRRCVHLSSKNELRFLNGSWNFWFLWKLVRRLQSGIVCTYPNNQKKTKLKRLLGRPLNTGNLLFLFLRGARASVGSIATGQPTHQAKISHPSHSTVSTTIDIPFARRTRAISSTPSQLHVNQFLSLPVSDVASTRLCGLKRLSFSVNGLRHLEWRTLLMSVVYNEVENGLEKLRSGWTLKTPVVVMSNVFTCIRSSCRDF